jgi:glycosyltransferase involved in cell wall biosynthesis
MKYTETLNNGKKKLAESTIIICAIVRDCGKNLQKNIGTMNRICDLAKAYHVIVFENDSVDNTKQVLKKWTEKSKNIHVSLNDFNSITISPQTTKANKAFTRTRIEKMAKYRNYYLEYIEKNQIKADYVIVVDLDVYNIDSNGILSSFGMEQDWDCITANGSVYSPSVMYRKRYYDTYALVECGMEDKPQTEKSIREAQYQWAFLKRGQPPIKVASAFGGLAIYKKEAIVACRYGVLDNMDEKVESRAEHFYLYQQMKKNGYDKIYINPAMYVRYQTQVIHTIRSYCQRLAGPFQKIYM